MKTTKTKVLAILVLALGLMVCPAELAGAEPIGTAFTYQGRLVDDNSAANGVYDFQFKVFDNVNLGKQQGSTIYIHKFKVIDGNFTVELDFGSGIFTGDARWLEIGVRPAGTGSFTILSPLQEVKPTPNSIHASHALQADEADTLNGLDSSAFASVAHSHDGVYALIGHTHSGSDITTGTVADGLIAATIARDSEITWGNLADIPDGFSDGIDNTGGADSDWKVSGSDMYSWVAGNVGIGTTNPQSKLSVGGDGIADTGVYGSDKYGVYGYGNGYGVSGEDIESGSYGRLGYDNYGVYGYGHGYGVYGKDADTGSYGSLGYGTYGGYFSGDGYFSGNVGIGTTSQFAKLNVDSLGDYAVMGKNVVSTDTGQYHDLWLPPICDGEPIWGVTEGYIGGRTNGAYGRFTRVVPPGDMPFSNYAHLGGYRYGIYAKAEYGFAGYFEGRVHIIGRTRIRGKLRIDDSTGAAVIELGAGLDYAEGFDVSESTKIDAGSVLIIDAENPGKLSLSTKPYDSKVAGIAAGAKGMGSGVRLGSDEFDCDVALAGRVYCNVDATEAPVEPGDLLTTSTTPGYAMKAADYMRAQGAILGKAMEKLEKGKKGQILVLVTLQ